MGIEIVGKSFNEFSESVRDTTVQLSKLKDALHSTVNILGTEYKIEVHKISEDSFMEKNGLEGWCGEDAKLIVIADYDEEKYFPDITEEEKDKRRKHTMRHEIFHAFLNESGLSACSSVPTVGWAKNEEMVDWFAIQSPKIYKVYLELGLI